MTNENERPSHCSDMQCTCIWHNRTEVFCVGSIEKRVDVIGGKEHTNDRRFCIHLPLIGAARSALTWNCRSLT